MRPGRPALLQRLGHHAAQDTLMELSGSMRVIIVRSIHMGRIICAVVVSLVLAIATTASAQGRRAATPAARGGIQNLPYATNDNEGNQWFLQQGGWLQSRGNMPVYSQ